LLDKFLALSEAEMYTECSVERSKYDMRTYTQKAKMLLSMMDNKIERIVNNPSRLDLGAFADGRSMKYTIKFTGELQMFIDLI